MHSEMQKRLAPLLSAITRHCSCGHFQATPRRGCRMAKPVSAAEPCAASRPLRFLPSINKHPFRQINVFSVVPIGGVTNRDRGVLSIQVDLRRIRVPSSFALVDARELGL